jgi:hypothetical protein
LQIAFIVATDLYWPGQCDPEYGVRLALVQRRIREHPERPLLVVVGSSRVGSGFLAQELPPLRDAAGRQVLPFNWSHLAAGPRMNLMQVRRLLAEGLTPTWLVLEILPGSLVHEGTPASFAVVPDLPALCHGSSCGRDLLVFLRCRLNPFYNNRQAILREVASAFVTTADFSDDIRLGPLGDDDGWMRREDLGDEVRANRAVAARAVYFDRLQEFRIDPAQDQATCELLDLCRGRGIRVALLVMPEDSRFRSWYSPETQRRLGCYLDQLRRTYDVPVMDARCWVGDDGFNDPHHLGLRGARVFTERLGREALQPLLAAR